MDNLHVFSIFKGITPMPDPISLYYNCIHVRRTEPVSGSLASGIRSKYPTFGHRKGRFKQICHKTRKDTERYSHIEVIYLFSKPKFFRITWIRRLNSAVLHKFVYYLWFDKHLVLYLLRSCKSFTFFGVTSLPSGSITVIVLN